MRADRITPASWWLWPTAALGAVATAVLLWWWEPAWSASAWTWLEVLAGGGGGPPHAAIGRGLLGLSKGTRMSPSTMLVVGQIALAATSLLCLFALGRAGGGRGASAIGLVTAALGVLWPVSRQALVAVSAEAVLSCASLLLAWACLGLTRRPRLAAIAVGASLLLMVVSHPIGLPAACLMLLVAAFYPQPRPDRTTEVPGEGVPARGIWTAWLAAATLCLLGLALALPDAGLERLWTAAIADIRTPGPSARVGGAAELPLVGASVGWLGRTPPALFLLAAATAAFGLGRGRRSPLGPIAAALGVWWLLATLFGHSLPGSIDPLVIAAPLICLLAVRGAASWTRKVWRDAHPARLAIAGALLGSLLLSVAADGVVLDAGESRTALGRGLGLIEDAAVGRPAVLLPDDLAVMRDQPGRLSVQPARRQGEQLARALAHLGVVKTEATFSAAFGAERILIRAPVTDPLGEALCRGRRQLACTDSGRSCLVRVSGR